MQNWKKHTSISCEAARRQINTQVILAPSRLTCDILFNFVYLADRVVVPENVQIKRGGVLAHSFPRGDVGYGPSGGHDVIVAFSEVQQLGQGLIEATVEADDQLEVRVGVEIDLPVGRVLDLLDHEAVAAEDGEGRASVVAGDVELLPTADLHGEDVTLEIIVEGGDLGARVVVHVGDAGGVIQVRVEELEVLPQTGSARDPPPQPVVAVLDGPSVAFAVDPH